MYKNNKYTKIYNMLIARAITRPFSKKECNKMHGYVEQHHIIPKSMGGDNSKSNLVFLTGREHFIAHMLLARMVIDLEHLNSMRFALWKFQQNNAGQDRVRITSHAYNYMKQEVAKASSMLNTGRKHAPRTQEYKDKISSALKGKESPLKGATLSDETKDKISSALKGRISPTKGKKLKPRTAIHTANQAKSRTGSPGRKGVKQTQETKDKISAANKGKVPWNKKPLPPTNT